MKKKEKNTEKKTGYSISGPVEAIENKESKINLENESTKFIVILLCIVAFIAMLWLVDSLRKNKNEENKNDSVASINYSEVIVGNMLDQKPEKYVVYAYNSEKNATVEYLLTLVGSNYKLNLELANNKIAVAEKSNFKGTIDQIKFKGETLLAIEKGKIVKTFEGNEEIIKYLESIKK